MLAVACQPSAPSPIGIWATHGRWQIVERRTAPPLHVAPAVVVRLCGDGVLLISDGDIFTNGENLWVWGYSYRGRWWQTSEGELEFEYSLHGPQKHPTIRSSVTLDDGALRFTLQEQEPHGVSHERGWRGPFPLGPHPIEERIRNVPVMLRPGGELPGKFNTMFLPCGASSPKSASYPDRSLHARSN
jgi:hypothetical protein